MRVGALNRYICDSIKAHTIVTVDLTEGVTPYMIECEQCMSTRGLRMFMRSQFYRNVGAEERITHEWYKPDLLERAQLDENTRNHVEMGGLLLRRRVQ